VRVGLIPEGPLERVIARLKVAPQPLVETQMAYTLARVIMAGADLGVFEALKEGPATAAEVAERCGTDPGATGKLLFALASTDYVRNRGERFELTPVARKWLLAESPECLTDKLRLQRLEWDWMGRSEEYVRTGTPLELHAMTEGETWGWTSGRTLGLAAAAVVLLVAWGMAELRVDEPMVDMRMLARREVLLANRSEVDLDGTLAGPVVRRHDAAGPRRGTLQLPPQRGRHPARDERRSDAVAAPIARVVDPELRDPGEKRPAVEGREELREAFAPSPQARPLKVSET